MTEKNHGNNAMENARKHSGVFAGIILILLGVILLLNILGVIQFSIWHGLATYWPVGLILIGIAMILRLRWFTVGFIILTVVLCTIFLADAIHSSDIAGSGVIINKTYDASEFSRIRLQIPAQVYITQSEASQSPSVIIRGDDNLLEMIDASVDGNTLKIRSTSGFPFWTFWGDRNIKVYITAQNIEEINIEGAGNIVSTNTIKAEELSITVSGAGDVDMDMVVNSLETEISGFGNLRLRGSANEYSAVISGAGDIDAQSFAVKNAELDVSGSGDARVNVSETLDVSISGAGDVKYVGSPKVTEHISGAGSVRKI